MIKSLRALLAALALVACGGEPSERADAPIRPATAETTEKDAAMTEPAPIAPPLDYRKRTLDNGLDVYALKDPSTALVSVHVWYDVGSKDDPKGRSGFAHLFEHIMFKATRNMPAETLDRLAEDVGGYNNASTYDDFTNYYETVPAAHLERILWAEAERMGSLVVDDEIFEAERDVVKEELRQRVYASPYGRLFYLHLAQANYDVHPYGRPGIGSIEDLDAASADDVRAFHAAYYRPDNAVLVVSGNFDDATLDAWVDRYFGPIAKPDARIPRVDAVEPRRDGPRDLTAYGTSVPLPAVLVSWPGIAARDPDLAALTTLDAILSRGESSRLYQSLVYDKQLAAEAFSFFEPTRDPSAVAIGAILSAGKTVEDGLAAIEAEIARLRDEPPTAAELAEAKNEIVTEKLQARETADGRAFELAESAIRYRDASYADELLAQIGRVSAEDVRDVARRIFDDEQRVVVRYFDDDDAPEDAPTIETSPTIDAAPLTPSGPVAVVSLAPEGERESPPAPGATVSATVPAASRKTLENGLEVIVAPRRGVPLVSASLRARGGAAAEPATLAGLAGLAAELTTKGAGGRDAVAFAEAVEALGASITPDADDDAIVLALQTRTDNLTPAFDLLADAALRPAFDADELERVRQQTLDDLQVSLSEPSSVAGRAIVRAVFGATGYGGVATERSLGAVARDDAEAFHARLFRPDNATLVFAGDVSAEDGFAIAERAFGDWSPDGSSVKTSSGDADAAGALIGGAAPRRIVVDLPGAGQAAVSVGGVGTPRRADDYLAAALAANVLGGGYSSRLNAEIRIKRGLSYGARTSMPARLDRPLVFSTTQTRNDAAVEVARLMTAEMNRLGAGDIDAAELAARKAVLVGRFGRSVETASGLAAQYGAAALFGLDFDRLATYADEVERIDAAAVAKAAKAYFDPAASTFVVVGDAAAFFDDFKAAYPDAERISIEDLDLDAAALK
ncbi:MAG: M16 family metallopeptidase [Parvularculaceae bacterium]